jgi:hypothetical protein
MKIAAAALALLLMSACGASSQSAKTSSRVLDSRPSPSAQAQSPALDASPLDSPSPSLSPSPPAASATPETTPPAAVGALVGRANAAMATDTDHHTTLLFGGYDGQDFSDTWALLGSTWSQRQTTGPPARNGAAMAYDPARHVTVLFGGAGVGAMNFLADTWTWDGSGWIQLRPDHSPSGRTEAAMGWDPNLGGLLLFGGSDVNGRIDQDTWLWEGADWRQINTAHEPPARYGAAVGYSTHTGALLLVGGDNFPQLAGWPDVWRFDGSDWSSFSASGGGPAPRLGAQIGFDSVLDGFLLFGGATASGGSLNDTWLLENGTWSTSPSPAPPRRGTSTERGAVAAASLTPGEQGMRGGFLLFGGHSAVSGGADNSGGYYADTWVFDGSVWNPMLS